MVVVLNQNFHKPIQHPKKNSTAITQYVSISLQAFTSQFPAGSKEKMANLSHSFAAVLVFILANFASAQQMPDTFLDMLASNKPALTPEQASQVVGFYNKTEIVRLTGDAVDHALKTAIEAAAAGGGSIDFSNVTAHALNESDIIKEYSFWIPSIDPKSGFFYGYRVVKDSSNTVSFPAVKRFIGAAMARPDGSILLVATNDQDTAIWQGVYLNDTIHLSYMEGTEIWDGAGENLIEDQTIFSAVLEKVQVPEGFVNNLKDALPLHVNKENIAAAAAASASVLVGGVQRAIFAAVVALIYTFY
jgi:hypothetical protein